MEKNKNNERRIVRTSDGAQREFTRVATHRTGATCERGKGFSAFNRAIFVFLSLFLIKEGWG